MSADLDHEVKAEDCSHKKALVCKEKQELCFQPMGVEDISISDDQMKCSNHMDSKHNCKNGRLNADDSKRS